MTSINRLRIVLLGLAILGVAVTLAAISHAQTPDYQWQLKLAEAEQATQPSVANHIVDDNKMVATPKTTGTTPAATAPARKPAALVAPKVLKQARRGYPVRGDWWTLSGAHLDSYAHLTTGRHAGRYDTAWLKTLTREEINSLHSDDHDGRVQWKYVVRPAKAPAAKAGRWVMQKFCTGSGCVWRRVWVAN